jgi:ABC-type transport system involved in cytochrome bd biosynthesis fused ATPase/permease subunit
VAPLRAELLALFQHDTPRQIAEIGVLGATGLVVGFGFARAAEALLRSAPRRRSLEAFLSQAPAPPRRPDFAPLPSLADADIVLDGVSIVYPGSSAQTPAAISHRWRPGTGLALLGDNGAGKSSLMLALLGLLEPSAGEIRIGDVCLSDVDPAALHEHIVYLPQHPFAALGASVGWHLGLWAKPGADRRQLEAALRAVDLFEALAQHRQGGTGSVLDVPLGRLSGGERRWLQLARVFLHANGHGGGASPPPLLIVLDEPEAGLDRSARRRLGRLIQQLSVGSRVLISAHDPAVIPEDFVTLTCARCPVEAPAGDRSRTRPEEQLPCECAEPRRQLNEG